MADFVKFKTEDGLREFVVKDGTARDSIGDLSELTTTGSSDLVSAINEIDADIGDLSGLDTEATTDLVSAINEVAGDVSDAFDAITDAYSSSATYKVGELCIYNNTLYRCTTAITTAEAWTAGHWTVTTIADEIENRVLFFTGVSVSATTGTILSKSDSRITADHVVASCVWTNPAYITTDVTWTTAAGSLTMTGTCSTATTAAIILVKKNN